MTVFTGASPHGQGHETGFAQIVADRLGVDPSVVEVIHGDTATGPMGLGTYGSRSLAIGGVAAAHAAEKIAAKCREIVAHNLEADPGDIELREGKFVLRGDPDQGMSLGEVAGCAYIDATKMPEGMELGLEQTLIYDPSNFVFPFGTHVCVVDVDPETGKVEVVRWVAVDDCGPAVNPMLIDGQVHGGVTHGIGQALYEQVVYDERGQLVTGTFVDYALPTAMEIPNFETDRTETKSPSNSLGVKGIGEAGTIAATPAVVNAVIDALRHEGISYIDMPLTPLRVWQALEEARGRGDGPRGASRASRCRRRARARPAPDRRFPKEVRHDRRRVRLRRRRVGRRRDRAARRRRRGRQAAGRRALAAAAHEAALRGAVAARRPAQGRRAARRPDRRRLVPDRRADAPLRAAGARGHGPDRGGRAQIADQQVRNRGTIGGSLAHGDTAADLPAALLAYDGTVIVRGSGGDREIAAADLFEGYMTTAVAPGEVLTQVRIPALVGYGYGYEKFNRRAEDWAMVGVCALVKAVDGVCEDVRIGLTHMGRRRCGRAPRRMPCAASRWTTSTSRRRRSSPPTGRARSATSMPPPSTSSTSRAC